ncbi:hypothetical protein QMK17_02575 [Rhodococcus sp. G-MC3]|nr:hypothetical protein [Rhodococcus sp. G-MC3]MDJ0392215.1 hypothetical protein [Rhodococcus sp. G-MC3]
MGNRRMQIGSKISAVVSAVVVIVAAPGATATADIQQFLDVGTVSVPRAECGPGSNPETGLQGDVPAEDRNSGRSAQGYSCNTHLVGGFRGQGGAITSTTFEHCSYTGSFFPGDLLGQNRGVQVVDASDPTQPVVTTSLTEPAMIGGTWETLKVNRSRKLLAATAVPFVAGGGYISVYDISDCAHPRLLNPGPGTNPAMPLAFLSHEGGFSPDGNTYWAASNGGGMLTAIDLADPSNPHVIWQGLTGIENHGFGVSPDGNSLYLSAAAGITVLDVSSVQRRDAYPQVPHIGRIFWTDGIFTQHSVPVTYDGVPHLFTVDEAGSGGVKLLDVSDVDDIAIDAKIKLEINLPQNAEANLRSSQGGSLFAYESHYCAADRPDNPTALACGWISSGIRVFDVRDPDAIREIAYYNPPALTGQNTALTNSAHAMASIIGIPALSFLSQGRAALEGDSNPANTITRRSGQVLFGDLSSDWCFSPPEWHGNQLWTSCSDNGFMIVQLDNDVYSVPADQQSTVGS